jgi:4'-phosphopantetheinyl transferase
LRVIGGCLAGPVDEMKFYPPKDPARFVPKVALDRLRSYILASYLSGNPGEVRLSYGQYGKPIVDTPSCPYTFSTSFSGKNWMLDISHENPVGVDIEQIKEIPDLISNTHQLFHTEQLNLISLLPPIEQTQAFFNLWTLKEAYLKATGKGWSG